MSLKGFFAENGLTEMMKASDFDGVDQVSPFIGSVVDVLCGNENCLVATTVVTLCFDLARFLFTR